MNLFNTLTSLGAQQVRVVPWQAPEYSAEHLAGAATDVALFWFESALEFFGQA